MQDIKIIKQKELLKYKDNMFITTKAEVYLNDGFYLNVNCDEVYFTSVRTMVYFYKNGEIILSMNTEIIREIYLSLKAGN